MNANAEASAPKRGRGKIEKSTRKTIKAMGLEGTEEQKMLVEQAIAGAKIMDEAMTGDRKRYIVSTGHRLQREALAGLRASVLPAPPPDENAGSTEEDDMGLWVAAIHRPSVRCQDSFPVVTPGACGDCDAAPRARAMYGQKHPDEPGHGYGMGRELCGCARCVAELASVVEEGEG